MRGLRRHGGLAALVVALLALLLAASGLAQAAGQAVFGASVRPRPRALLLLGPNAKFPASAIPTVTNARHLGGRTLRQVQTTCPSGTVDLNSWCLSRDIYPVPASDAGLNNYFYATQACVAAGGYLPTAGQLIGAANRVPLESVLTDDPNHATVDQDPTNGLKDQREMSATLVTTAAGSAAAGSEGISDTATGDPRTGEPNPTPQPANPDPETLQYVTVYDNHGLGGFAGSAPVSAPENFRCAYNKVSQP